MTSIIRPTSDGRENTPAYIGFKACGHAVAAVVDDGRFTKEVAKTVAQWVRDGLAIERKTVGWARENMNFCDCKERAKMQEDLFTQNVG